MQRQGSIWNLDSPATGGTRATTPCTIDGTDLYPGFELDEFCAVFIALDSYLKETNDWEFVDDTVLKACEDFLTELAEWKGETVFTNLPLPHR